MTRQRSVADLMKEQDGQPTCKLGPVRFRLNPGSYEQTSDRAIVDVQTQGGYGRYDFGAKPRQYRLSLSTGLAGAYGPSGVQDLRQFEPQPGKPDTLWPFEFPGEFRGKRWVKVNEFKLTRDSGSPYVHLVDLVLEEYPKELMVSARKVPGSLLSTPLPVGG
jgi:hypothetical protein